MKFKRNVFSEIQITDNSRITSITDELILSEMDSVYRLTDAERDAIAEGLKDAKEGRASSSEAAENMIKEWLAK